MYEQDYHLKNFKCYGWTDEAPESNACEINVSFRHDVLNL